MGNVQCCGDAARIVNILPRATRAFAMGSLAMIIELQCDADDVIALLGQ